MKALVLLLSGTFLMAAVGCQGEESGSPSNNENSGAAEDSIAADLADSAQPDSEALDLFGLEDDLGAGQEQIPGQPAPQSPQNLPEGAVREGSLASPQLINDAVQNVAAVAAASMECSEIENFVPYVEEMPEGSLGSRTWRERWVFQGCGREYPVEMSFSETAQGVEWSIEGDHAALRQSPKPQPQPQPQPQPGAQQPEAMEPEQVTAQIGASFKMLDVCDIEPTGQMTDLRDMQRTLFEQSGMGVEAFDAAFEAGRQQVQGEWDMLSDEQQEASCEAVQRDLERAEG